MSEFLKKFKKIGFKDTNNFESSVIKLSLILITTFIKKDFASFPDYIVFNIKLKYHLVMTNLVAFEFLIFWFFWYLIFDKQKSDRRLYCECERVSEKRKRRSESFEARTQELKKQINQRVNSADDNDKAIFICYLEEF